MENHGFLRVAAAVPKLALADCRTNAERHLELLSEAESRGVRLVVFPECSLTGYTCGDLFHQSTLLDAAEEALANLIRASKGIFRGIAVVGLPASINGLVLNVAAIFSDGRLVNIVPKTHLPNYREFYDARYFASGWDLATGPFHYCGQTLLHNPEAIFNCGDFTLGVEICEDLWVPQPPSSRQAARGANVLVNLSASNETIGKSAYRRQLVANQSARCIAGYLYAGSGTGESSSDVVFGGHSLIAENGVIMAESTRFQTRSFLQVADLDLQHLQHDRNLTNSFHRQTGPGGGNATVFLIDQPLLKSAMTPLERRIDPHPFVPSDAMTLKDRCEEIFHIQTTALARRLEAARLPTVSIGVSGGIDSTLALLVLVKTLELLKMPRSAVQALTMPGFGTTNRTKANAHTLMEQLGLTAREVDIRSLTLDQMRALGQKPFGIDLAGETVQSFTKKLPGLPADRRSDLTFENTQARIRTGLLMNSGFVIGTGDLSELCLGWCTYNADHMSMYNVNVSIPKTLVKFLVQWVAENEFDGEVRKTLLDIVATVISPELLPAGADGSVQSTEDAIGPYELHDFFIYHMLRWGSSPAKILYLAGQATFDKTYTLDEIRKWIRVFVTRFFANQFKRNCIPDGPKVGSVSISPRGDWRMPSDASAAEWLRSVESL